MSLKSAILPSLSIARLDVILQHHFIFGLFNREMAMIQEDRKSAQSNNNSGLGTPSVSAGSSPNGSPTSGTHGFQDLQYISSRTRPILNPAELAEMEEFLGSVPGKVLALYFNRKINSSWTQFDLMWHDLTWCANM